jgi:two-component system phosphate regulon sensor histidine kinase PhoR
MQSAIEGTGAASAQTARVEAQAGRVEAQAPAIRTPAFSLARIRTTDLWVVVGVSILALAILALWTGEWLFAAILASSVAGIGAARIALVKTSPVALSPAPFSAQQASAIDGDADAGSQLSRLIDCLPNPILIADRNGRVIVGNHRFQQHFGTAEPRKHVANLIRAPAVLEALDAVLVGAAPRTVEFAVLSSPEQSFEAHVAPLEQEGGKAKSALLIFHDVTKAKRIEEMRADFVANASHELRTPLASLTGFIETLRGHAKDDPQARERFLGIMSEQAGRMRRLIDDLLSLSRIELNEHIKPSGSVNLGDVVEEVVSALQPQMHKAEMVIKVQEPPSLPHVAGEREEIVQIVQNLLDNAIKYGRKGAEILVDLSLKRAAAGEQGPSPAVVVTVEDHGEGIAREHLPRLTERFYRVDVRRSREAGGTGLGLAIVKHIVNRHRGRLAIESKVGEGSKFSVYLPLAPSPQHEDRPVAALPQPSAHAD